MANRRSVIEQQVCESFARWLKIYVKARGVSLRLVAQQVNMSPSAVANLARGDACPTLPTLFKLAEFFHVDPPEALEVGGFPEVAEWIRSQQGVTHAVADSLDPRVRAALGALGRPLTEDETLALVAILRAFEPRGEGYFSTLV